MAPCVLAWRAIAPLVLVLSTSPALAAAPSPTVITRPDWVQKPSGEDMARVFPPRAREEYRGGSATIACRVDVTGGLVDCAVEREAPQGDGFGAAALSLSAMFHMKPKTIDGQAVDGGSVTIPIIFGAPPRPVLGDTAIVLKRIDPGLRATLPPDAVVTRCPDSADQCQGHYFEWASKPDGAQMARILALATPEGAGTGTQCTVAANGALEDCLFAGDVSAGSLAAAREAVGLLRAPTTTGDGVVLAGSFVRVLFEWRAYAAEPAHP